MTIINYTEKWLALYVIASKLEPKKFERFMFGVGFYGSDMERYRKGKATLEILCPTSTPEVSFSFSSDIEDNS